MIESGDALLLVDLQLYYVDPAGDFFRYSEFRHPGSMHYIAHRWQNIVEPAVRRLLAAFRTAGQPIIYLRLCGEDPERRDLHRFFQESYADARDCGFPGIYPLAGTAAAENPASIAPLAGETIFTKTTFSGFHSGGLHAHLQSSRETIQRLVIAGLATSQCVETTARDASDLGFGVTLIEDALADYSETAHLASLFACQAVCGGDIRYVREYLS